MKRWTKAESRRLRKLYPHVSTKDAARDLRRSVSSVYNQAFLLGLKKTAAYLASDASGRLTKLTRAGRAHRFPKGHRTWNRGLKGWQAGGRAKETQFRKGARGARQKPVGAERIDADGYPWVKVAEPNVWMEKQRVVWEREHGPVPRGHIVVFRDRDRMNFATVNLECISRAENMRRNTYHRYPKEIARLIQLRGALNRQIRKREGGDGKRH